MLSRLINRQVLLPYASVASRSYSIPFYEPNHSIPKYDIAVIGGGIVGVATARELIMRHPTLKIVVLEKESGLARHQSGHNSGVVHAGIYYKPGSLKAKLCVEGIKLAYEYFDKNDIPYKKCGKLIVAVNHKELDPLNELHKRGLQNGVRDLKMIDGDDIPDIEPHCVGLKALWSPHTGIVDWAKVTESFSQDFERKGGSVMLLFRADSFTENTEDPDYPVLVSCNRDQRSVKAKYVLTCCGLQSDLVATKSGCSPNPRIIPFRGEFLKLHPARSYLVRGNIYPVPDPRFPFLGVHFTPHIDGSVLLGPNAVLALEREGYRWAHFNLKDMFDIISYKGFRKMAYKYAGFGFMEMMRSLMIPLQIVQLQKYIPELTMLDVERGPAGVRAQAMDTEGNLIEDFVFDMHSGIGTIGSHILHCRNAPSPGATSSLAIAKMIADKMKDEFNL